MNHDFENKQAEDIFSDERLLKQLEQQTAEGKEQDKQPMMLACRILHIFKTSRKQLGLGAKKQLADRIDLTIGRYKRRVFIAQVSVAASVLVLLGTAAVLQLRRQPGIVKYAFSQPSVSSVSNTRLYLAANQIEIESNESSINYSDNGELIAIDASETINQQSGSGEPMMNTILVPFGKRARLTLSDQSKVWLNSGSKLVFPAKFDGKKREVFLEGEAIFEVSHHASQPFHVLTNELDIRVLGTVFNVCAYADDSLASTVLVQGAVALTYPGNKLLGNSALQMSPGMLVDYNSTTRTIASRKVDPLFYTSWRDGYLVFQQQKLGDIIKKIARYYNVSIRLDDADLAGEVFSGNLDLKSSAPEVLAMVAEIVNARIEPDGNQLIIKRNS